jgi:hypothetical protein
VEKPLKSNKSIYQQKNQVMNEQSITGEEIQESLIALPTDYIPMLHEMGDKLDPDSGMYRVVGIIQKLGKCLDPSKPINEQKFVIKSVK